MHVNHSSTRGTAIVVFLVMIMISGIAEASVCMTAGPV